MSHAPPVASPSIIQSGLLSAAGVPHGFSTRQGGVSTGIFDSLSFGNPSDLPAPRRDPPGNIAANLRRVLDAVGAGGPAPRAVIQVHQVHGAGVHIVRQAGAAGATGVPTPKADAIVTDDPAVMLAVRVADCAPVLLASADGRVVGAVHAGWRGVIAGVVPAAIEVMWREFGAAGLIAAIGPCIGRGRFEVGPEVAAEFDRAFPPEAQTVAPAGAGARPHVDLRAALHWQLRAAGIERVDSPDLCTFDRADLFFSHRRDRGETGRMVGLIGPRPGETGRADNAPSTEV